MVQGSGELDFILVYRNSGEWTLESWMEKRFVCAQISVPSAAYHIHINKYINTTSSISIRFFFYRARA